MVIEYDQVGAEHLEKWFYMMDMKIAHYIFVSTKKSKPLPVFLPGRGN
jgi:hypothetical protein